jgi:hypothetical protein
VDEKEEKRSKRDKEEMSPKEKGKKFSEELSVCKI